MARSSTAVLNGLQPNGKEDEMTGTLKKIMKRHRRPTAFSAKRRTPQGKRLKASYSEQRSSTTTTKGQAHLARDKAGQSIVARVHHKSRDQTTWTFKPANYGVVGSVSAMDLLDRCDGNAGGSAQP